MEITEEYPATSALPRLRGPHRRHYVEIQRFFEVSSFWREGVITRPDARGRHLRLTMANGSYQEIRCDMGATSGSSCLFGREFPISARVELFEYKGFWMIFSIYDLNKKIIIVDKIQRIKIYRYLKNYFSTLTPEHEFWGGLYLGISIIPIGILFAFMSPRKDRILAQRRAANAK